MAFLVYLVKIGTNKSVIFMMAFFVYLVKIGTNKSVIFMMAFSLLLLIFVQYIIF